jgi:hypothetical protein
MKYGTAQAGSDGSDVIRSILEETGDALSDRDAMSGVERAIDDFRGHSSAYGTAYKEWAKGNYVDDTGSTPQMRFTAPLYARPKEAGEVGTGANVCVWHDTHSTILHAALSPFIYALSRETWMGMAMTMTCAFCSTAHCWATGTLPMLLMAAGSAPGRRIITSSE